ncbi:MAG: hypothetical protein U9Q39_00930 [Pseudomonadota bacterium]|nr:hypothetical protein [Pseudomonadota bacterium]
MMSKKISLSAGQISRFVKLTILAVTFASMAISLPLWAQESGRQEKLLDMAALLKERETTIKSREAALDEKEMRINMLQDELRNQEREMQKVRASVEKLMAEFQALKEEDLSRLVEVYSAMKPDAAAPLLGALELKYAVEVILRMQPKKSAKLLSVVEAERAVAISRAITELKPVE